MAGLADYDVTLTPDDVINAFIPFLDCIQLELDPSKGKVCVAA